MQRGFPSPFLGLTLDIFENWLIPLKTLWNIINIHDHQKSPPEMEINKSLAFDWLKMSRETNYFVMSRLGTVNIK